MENSMKNIYSQSINMENFQYHQIRQNAMMNLEFIQKHSNSIMNKIESGQDLDIWMLDKISTARNDLNDVNMGLVENKNE